ncbi:hypothetical protein EIN_497550 [Entamoeba invadens IP1]|uniref:TLDc domain-containing protein n=1 Tax=Entamoeba invadens IP1 TaxID=370355 RepID=A0A0A1UG78_ENTIV|nr:hypothetical protein EIN_497550 [Entamoeba invadens IP1]ELP94595.1 hypothetical protein EIN_497550 [Entamoeba invadens IP1]|eukprot:XP_004261366.1 hypothetical protein EIN_497550 [Entamoeba invadens IP1]
MEETTQKFISTIDSLNPRIDVSFEIIKNDLKMYLLKLQHTDLNEADIPSERLQKLENRRTELTRKVESLQRNIENVSIAVKAISTFIGNSTEEIRLDVELRKNSERKEELGVIYDKDVVGDLIEIGFDGIKEAPLMMNESETILIQKWTNLLVEKVIFDSYPSTDKKNNFLKADIVGKSNLLFVIESVDGEKYGGYVKESIHEQGVYVKDENAFVFTFNTKGRLESPLMFKMKKECADKAFVFCKQKQRSLCVFGEKDICIGKRKRGSYYCVQKCFEYNGIENALTGVGGNIPLKIKRYVLYQMCQNSIGGNNTLTAQTLIQDTHLNHDEEKNPLHVEVPTEVLHIQQDKN